MRPAIKSLPLRFVYRHSPRRKQRELPIRSDLFAGDYDFAVLAFSQFVFDVAPPRFSDLDVPPVVHPQTDDLPPVIESVDRSDFAIDVLVSQAPRHHLAFSVADHHDPAADFQSQG